MPTQELESRTTVASFRRKMDQLLGGEPEVEFEANERIRGSGIGKGVYLGHEDVQTPMTVRAVRFRGGYALSFQSEPFSTRFELTRKGPQIYRAGNIVWEHLMAVFPDKASEKRALIGYGNQLADFAQQHKPAPAA